MFSKYSNKQKFYASLIVVILLFLAVYKKTLKPVFTTKKELIKIDQNLKNVTNSEFTLISLKAENKGLDVIIGGQTTNPEKVQQRIFDFIARLNKEVNLVNLDDVHISEGEKFRVYTNSLEFEGAYTDLIEMLYEIEINFQFSKVISSKIASIKDFRTNKTYLRLIVILQNYEKII